MSGGDTTRYRYGSGWEWHRHVEELNEESGAGTLQATYVHSSSGGSATPGRQIGTVLATSAGSTASSGTWAYYFQDAIGSTRGLWDDDADRIGKYDYTPFGGKYSDSGEDITRKFTGHDWDSASRLYYTAYRYYSPDANRWLTRDPLGMVDGPNVYAYVMGNPVSIWDALGQCGINANTAPGGGGADIAGDIWTGLGCLATFAGILVALHRALGGRWTSIGVVMGHCAACLIALSAAIAIGYPYGYSERSQVDEHIVRLIGFYCMLPCLTAILGAAVMGFTWQAAVGVTGVLFSPANCFSLFERTWRRFA